MGDKRRRLPSLTPPCEPKIPSLNANKFAYIKKLLYLCTRICKIGNCVTAGVNIVATVARQLQEDYGTKGFEERTVRRMMKFAQLFPDFQIVSTLLSKLSWSHFLIVMQMKTSPESVSRNILLNYHPRKFSCVNCKNPLRQQGRICL